MATIISKYSYTWCILFQNLHFIVNKSENCWRLQLWDWGLRLFYMKSFSIAFCNCNCKLKLFLHTLFKWVFFSKYTNTIYFFKSMSMTDAMNEGRVLMEFVSKKKIREEKNSYGLITIKITKVVLISISRKLLWYQKC